MKHLLFPTVAQADAFVQDLQAQGVIQPEMGQTSLNRSGGVASGMSSTGGMSTTTTTTRILRSRSIAPNFGAAPQATTNAGNQNVANNGTAPTGNGGAHPVTVAPTVQTVAASGAVTSGSHTSRPLSVAGAAAVRLAVSSAVVALPEGG